MQFRHESLSLLSSLLNCSIDESLCYKKVTDNINSFMKNNPGVTGLSMGGLDANVSIN